MFQQQINKDMTSKVGVVVIDINSFCKPKLIADERGFIYVKYRWYNDDYLTLCGLYEYSFVSIRAQLQFKSLSFQA